MLVSILPSAGPVQLQTVVECLQTICFVAENFGHALSFAFTLIRYPSSSGFSSIRKPARTFANEARFLIQPSMILLSNLTRLRLWFSFWAPLREHFRQISRSWNQLSHDVLRSTLEVLHSGSVPLRLTWSRIFDNCIIVPRWGRWWRWGCGWWCDWWCGWH